jgi:hypothetical protein
MPRLFGVLVFVATLGSVSSAWAGHDKVKGHGVPELGTAGAAAGIALIAGATAIAFGRRRGRKS